MAKPMPVWVTLLLLAALALAHGATVAVPMPPDGLVTAYEHDALGREVRTVADAEGEKIAALNAFDAAGRLVKTVADAGGANEGATSYAHDPNGDLIEQTDATGRKVKYAYDALNRRVAS